MPSKPASPASPRQWITTSIAASASLLLLIALAVVAGSRSSPTQPSRQLLDASAPSKAAHAQDERHGVPRLVVDTLSCSKGITGRPKLAFCLTWDPVPRTVYIGYPVPWRKSNGRWADQPGKRPSCMPTDARSIPVRVGYVALESAGSPEYDAVAWVDCADKNHRSKADQTDGPRIVEGAGDCSKGITGRPKLTVCQPSDLRSFFIGYPVPWRTTDGRWANQPGKRPTCMPTDARPIPLRVGYVDLGPAGSPEFDAVAWVDCSDSSAPSPTTRPTKSGRGE